MGWIDEDLKMKRKDKELLECIAESCEKEINRYSKPEKKKKYTKMFTKKQLRAFVRSMYTSTIMFGDSTTAEQDLQFQVDLVGYVVVSVYGPDGVVVQTLIYKTGYEGERELITDPKELKKANSWIRKHIK